MAVRSAANWVFRASMLLPTAALSSIAPGKVALTLFILSRAPSVFLRYLSSSVSSFGSTAGGPNMMLVAKPRSGFM